MYDVLILGGGVAGVTTAQQLHEAGIDYFLIVEARDDLGGAGYSDCLALVTAKNNWEDHQFYDEKGHADSKEAFTRAKEAYGAPITGAGERMDNQKVNLTARSGYSSTGLRPQDKYDWPAEYHHFDWEYAQTPEESSWITTLFNYNFTFDASKGGFSDENLLSVDQQVPPSRPPFSHADLHFRCTSTQASNTFCKTKQPPSSNLPKSSSTVTITSINYSNSGVSVRLKSGNELKAKIRRTPTMGGKINEKEKPSQPTSSEEVAIDEVKAAMKGLSAEAGTTVEEFGFDSAVRHFTSLTSSLHFA
ncbi:hypothetical protein M407DRAFT_32355 [Tulasnella calospora MUT 4182]|uniref:Uncharacterized protein n=1 Tax=Tulasnella calospora MUT 4182 TaxID=1051891 RepID=A0A0C3L935_9AGAM|nr:hypothetical protein M407DRAFT_32355 [Tulasnella calospora MUT 4182]